MSRKRNRRNSKRRGQPAKELTLSQSVDRFDQLQSRETETISSRDSYRLSTWVRGAISLIAETAANLPFFCYGPGTGKEPLTSGPLFDLINRPNDYDQQNTSTKFRIAYLTELLLNGAVMRAFPAMDGFVPTSMLVYPRWRFQGHVVDDENGMRVVSRWTLRARSITRTFIPGDDIYHDSLYNPYDDIEGLSPLQAALLTINNEFDSGEFTQRFFRNDSSTGIIFSSDHDGFKQDQADNATKRWNELHAGKQNAFGAKFVGYGLKPTSVGNPFDGKAHAVLKSLSKEEIVTGIYKIPLELFGVESSSQGVTIGDRKADTAQESFLVNVIQPWTNRYDEEINRDVSWRFGGGFRCEHSFTEHPLLEKRRLERARAAAELLDRGVPLNSVIRWLKLQVEMPSWGDEWFVPNNMIPASVIHRLGEVAFFQGKPSPSNAGSKPSKPGVRDSRGQKPKASESVQEYAESIARLAQTSSVRNSVNRDNPVPGVSHLISVLKELE